MGSRERRSVRRARAAAVLGALGAAGAARLQRLGPDRAGRQPGRHRRRRLHPPQASQGRSRLDHAQRPQHDRAPPTAPTCRPSTSSTSNSTSTPASTPRALPSARPAKLENTLTAQAKQLCPDAIIGSGQAGAEIAFPEQAPFFAKAPMVIFNGPPKNGHPVFIFHVYAHVPAPTTFVTTAEIGKASGPLRDQRLHQDPDDRRRPGLAQLRRTLDPQKMVGQGQGTDAALRDLSVRALLRARRTDLQRRLQDGRQSRAQLLAERLTAERAAQAAVAAASSSRAASSPR